jgi:YesN/AraC family two-component response regulator
MPSSELNILIVDDEDLNLRALESVFKKIFVNIRVTKAVNGEEGLAKFK